LLNQKEQKYFSPAEGYSLLGTLHQGLSERSTSLADRFVIHFRYWF
jgi:hypothetical protein